MSDLTLGSGPNGPKPPINSPPPVKNNYKDLSTVSDKEIVVSALKSMDIVDNVKAFDLEELNSKFPLMMDKINTILETMTDQLEKEDTQRESLTSYFKVFLVFITFIPLAVSVLIYLLADNSFGIGIIAAVISIPIEVLGVFGIIASKLFDDPYRKTIPEMIFKVVEVLKNSNSREL